MFAFLGWMLIGLLAGAFARLLVPGRQPMGIFMTMILGMVGSLVGGVISMLIFGQDVRDPGFHASGFIGSTIGAIIVLALFLRMGSRRTL